jgi:hypothetical protein
MITLAPEFSTVELVVLRTCAVALQFVNPVGSVIAALSGIEFRAEKRTVIVSPVRSAPVDEEVKSIVHVARAFAFCGEAPKATAVGVVAAAIVMLPAGLAGLVSALVATVQFARAYVPASPFVTPATMSAPDWLAFKVQPGGRVTTIVGPVELPAVFAVEVAGLAQLPVYPAPVRVTAGLVGTEKPEGMPSVIVSPPRRAPVALVVSPIVHGVRALSVCAAPAKETPVAAVAAPIVTLDAGLAAAGSSVVRTVNLVLAKVAAGGFTMPATVNAPDCPAFNEHATPLSVTESVEPETEPVAVQPL